MTIPQSPSRGRPADPRKDEQILEAAERLFMQHGVQGTTMDHIAREAAVSKLTLYRRYEDKDTLFTAVIGKKMRDFVPDTLFEITPDADPAQVLQRIGIAFMELITSEDAVNLNRIITAESANNPALCNHFYKEGPARLKILMNQLMAGLKQHGLNITSPSEAAEMFSALIIGSEYTKRCNMNMGPAPTRAQIKAYTEKATAFFLRACRP